MKFFAKRCLLAFCDRGEINPQVTLFFRRRLILLISFALAGILILTGAASGGIATFSEHSPGHNSIVTVATPRIAVHVSAPAELNPATVSAKIYGSPVGASFAAATSWDLVTGATPGVYEYSIVTDLKRGVINIHAPPLANGVHRVDVSIRDAAGNLYQDSWTFTVSIAPVISETFPTGNIRERTPQISAKAAAGGVSLDSGSIVLQLNGQIVSHHFEQTTGLVTYTPPQPLTDGEYQVRLQVRDQAGISTLRDWHFRLDASPPSLTSMMHFRDGMIVSDPSRILRFAARLNDSSYIKDNATLSLNGVPLPITFSYAGRWVWINQYEGEGYFEVTSRREANIEYSGVVPNGSHTLTLRTEDSFGNVREDNWTFIVASAPVITALLPTGIISEQRPLITAKITAACVETPVNPATVVLQLNGQTVSHQFNQATGLLFYTPPQPLADGGHQVRLQVRDLAGNAAVREWHFTVDTTPPSFSLQHFSDGMIITDTNRTLRFTARLSDSTEIRDNATLSLNGIPLPATFSFPGRWVHIYEQDSFWQVASRREATVEYSGSMANGRHTLTLRIEDALGNVRVDNWTFTVAAPLVISDPSPVAYGISEFRPLISARIRGVGAAVYAGSIVMQLNGQTVAHRFDQATGLVSYTPSLPLANESYHAVTLKASDLSGMQAEKSWRFYTNTFPDMADANIANCFPCHRQYLSTPSFGYAHSPRRDLVNRPWLDCIRCHNYKGGRAGCQSCHTQQLLVRYTPHEYGQEIRPRALNYDPLFPVRVLESREPWDCVICHQPGSGVTLNHHDLPDLHKVEPSSCDSCHARSLTREHAREGRLDANNQPITCLTCHQSSNIAVSAAVAAQDKSCAACHPAAATGDAHAELHDVRYGSVCIDCHSDNMMTEKVYHNNNCISCHEAASPQAQSAIQWQKRSCFDCHSQPHGVFMAVIPEDIPLNPAVTWSKPQEASIWNGEGWLPEEFNNPAGRVIFSNRVRLEARTVYDFYKAEMERAGWILRSGSYKPGDSHFTLHYTKGRRHCIIWFYSGNQPGVDGQNPQGQRVQIAYH